MEVPEEALKALKAPQSYHKVYKEECVFDFTNPYAPEGLYVNLKTFQAVSKDFLPLDQKRNRNFPLYLHQSWTRKVKDEDKSEGEGQAKPTKFAVGVKGGFELPDSKIQVVKANAICLVSKEGKEVKRAVYDQESRKGFPAPLVQVVDSILNRTDSTESKDIFTGSLDEEVVESKFAKDLVQLDNGVKVPNDPDAWKCAESGLKKNLWLNLSTGYIGSGRKETGGTEAAIKHFEDTGRKYPLVVKLGTITPESADVYSYAENKMVLDPLLDAHLKHWGLDRSKLYKTDKDMTQIQIDAQSKAFEASAITGEEEQQKPVKGLGFQGLVNFGNSCYINSTLQMLMSIDEFKKRYVNHAESVFQRAPSDPGADITTQLCKLAVALNSTKYQTESEANKALKTKAKLPELGDPAIEIRPKMLKKAIAKDHYDFAGGRQQDAQEYILHVFKAISRDAGAFPNTPGAQDLTKLFEFALEEKTVDDQSKQVGLKVQNGQTFLTIPIPKASTKGSQHQGDGQPLEKKSKTDVEKKALPTEIVPVEKCFEQFCSPSMLEGYTSPVTQKKGVAFRSQKMRTFPHYLLIQMYRFEQVDRRAEGKGYQIQKIRRQVPMPQQLDLKALASTGLLENEKALPKAKKSKPKANDDIVAAVMNMGFTKNAAIRAAINTQNSGAEQAVMWVLGHTEDPDLNSPMDDDGDDEEADTDGVDPNAVAQIAAMGLPAKHAPKALKACNGDVGRAIEWLFSRQGQLDDESKAKVAKVEPGKNPDPSKYELLGFVSHIGDNAMSGHYVSHLKKGGKWALFNDNKITLCDKPPFGLGYIYLYKRI